MHTTPRNRIATRDRRRATARGLGVWTLLMALLAALFLAGCGSAPATSDAPEAESSDPVALVARASGEVEVFEDPMERDPAKTLAAKTSFGSRTVLLVSEVGEGPADGWFEVLLPGRPLEATGWISGDDVEVREVDLEVDVDLTARELTVRNGGQVVLTTTTGTGSSDYPTPTGRFYLTDKLDTPNPGGPYGPYALGLSAYSEVLTEFMGGKGQIGIHGTNDPGSIGQDSSHGCLRFANDVIERLAHLLPLGTPVTIR